jgi:ubiquinone/menaquinone biosynthesis C-methylase UbiE
VSGLTLSLYADRVLPHIVHISMRQAPFSDYRRRLVPAAWGRVLEVGMGSGLNLPFYSERVHQVIGLDRSSKPLAMARQSKSMYEFPFRIGLLRGSADRIPMADRSVDTVLSTWTLCTVPDLLLALNELRRVLSPCGSLLFVEHGRSPDRMISRWQDRITPTWKRVAGGCHLNRPIDLLVESAGFRMERLEMGYMTGPRLMTFMYEGRASPL